MGCGAGRPEQKYAAKTEGESEVKPDGTTSFVIDHAGKIKDHYDIKDKLGEGAYGSVSIGMHKMTGQKRAIKVISRAKSLNSARIMQEIAIMKVMTHPNVIKLYETFQDKRSLYLVMEVCSGGELFDRIIDAGSFTEVQAAIVMQQIVRAIYYLHDQKICHRDVKPENFLFASRDPIEKNVLKIIDFGLACKFKPGVFLTTKAGTPYYVAPQVLQGKYDQQSDIWSCGVIMYVLLCGYAPFFGADDIEVIKRVKLGQYSFDKKDWKNVSKDAKQLIKAMLTMNPVDRIDAAGALAHPWIKAKAPNASKAALQSNFVDSLQGFRSQNRLKKAALHVIAGQMSEDQVKNLREIFTALDDNGDGQLTVSEIKDGMQKAGIKEIPPDLQQIMEQVDVDGSGIIDYTEFLAATLDKKLYLDEAVVWRAFQVFDRDGDGFISQDELKAVLGDQKMGDLMGQQAIAQLLLEVDTNGDGKIEWSEFLEMMRGVPQEQVADCASGPVVEDDDDDP